MWYKRILHLLASSISAAMILRTGSTAGKKVRLALQFWELKDTKQSWFPVLATLSFWCLESDASLTIFFCFLAVSFLSASIGSITTATLISFTPVICQSFVLRSFYLFIYLFCFFLVSLSTVAAFNRVVGDSVQFMAGKLFPRSELKNCQHCGNKHTETK